MSNAVKKENSALELVKSAAVIPVVVAIVLGLGWGLVRWAHARQVDSGKPDPRPAKVNADGSIELEIPFAQVTGEIHFGGGRRAHLGNWKRKGETVAWKFELDKPGRYAVELECACDTANAGSVVRIELDQASVEVTVAGTGEGIRSNRSRPARSTWPPRAGTNCKLCRFRYLTILSWFCGEFA